MYGNFDDFSGNNMGFQQNTQFDNNNNTQYNNNNNFASQTQNRVQQSNNDRHLPAVTIKQLLTAPTPMQDDPLTIDGVETREVLVIGQIVYINVNSTRTNYHLDDGTGVISVNVWGSNGDSNNTNTHVDMNQLKQDTYVKVNGRLNVFQGNITLTAHSMKPLTDMNELTAHFCECLYTHLYKKKKNSINGNNNENNMRIGNNMNSNNNINNNNNNSNNNGFDMDVDSDLNTLQKKIVDCIRKGSQPNDETGCNVDNVFKSFPSHLINDLREAVEELSNSGKIYSTVDDEHYKVCE